MTAFSVGKGLQFKVTPFALCNSSATIEQLIEDVLRKLLYLMCLVYLDDIISIAKTFDNMVNNLGNFLEIKTSQSQT